MYRVLPRRRTDGICSQHGPSRAVRSSRVRASRFLLRRRVRVVPGVLRARDGLLREELSCVRRLLASASSNARMRNLRFGLRALSSVTPGTAPSSRRRIRSIGHRPRFGRILYVDAARAAAAWTRLASD